jgi:hypothetical protein
MMQNISAMLDWSRMLGFEQIVTDRAALRRSGKLDAKVGNKPGLKLGLKVGGKAGVKAGLKV